MPSHQAMQGTPTANVGERDLRSLFALESRCTPALFAIAALAGYAAGESGWSALAWLAAFILNGAVRCVVTVGFERDAKPVTPRSSVALTYLATYAAELLLWLLLFTAVAPINQLFDRGAGYAAAGAVLVAALTIGTWPRAWRVVLLGWFLLSVVIIGGTGWTLNGFSIGFPLWLLAAAWMGVQQRSLRAATRWLATRVGAYQDREPAGTGQARRSLIRHTRFGSHTAIGAIPDGVIVLRHGRITDVNSAAAQFFERDEMNLLGRPIAEVLLVDPAEALDPARAQRESASVRVARVGRGGDGRDWTARVRILEPGEPGSNIIIALQQPGGPATLSVVEPAGDRLLEDAAELGRLLGSQNAQPWFRDERGHVFVPSEFEAKPQADAAPDANAFPLLPWVPAAQRAEIDAKWRAQINAGRVFDAYVVLTNAQGAAVRARVAGRLQAPRAGHAPVIGIIAPQPASAAAVPVEGAAGALLQQLPVLVWRVDECGRVTALHGTDGKRWGLLRNVDDSPLWSEAFGFTEDARADLLNALRRALGGKPSFDLINARTTQSGGRIVLRSHLVPHTAQADAGRGVLVMDTIAAPTQLAEIDRLRRSRAQYKALVEASTSLIWACDAHFRFTFVSRRAARDVYGYDPEELTGVSLSSLLAPGSEQTQARQALAGLCVGRSLQNVEMTHRAKDGRTLMVSVCAAPIRGSDGSFAGAIGMNADLTALKLRERRLAQALRIERTVLDSAGQAIAVVKDGVVARCNDAFLQLLQSQPEMLSRTPVAEYFASTDDWPLISAAAEASRNDDRAAVREVQIRRSARAGGGLTSWCQLTARSIGPGEYVIVLADIDHIRSREAEALHHAHHDELTGLPNRRLLATRAMTGLATATQRNAQSAVLAIDLDGFKEINDRYGHEMGDSVLREVAMRLSRVVRPQDTVARRGGDEFALFVPDAGSRAEVERIASRVLTAVGQRFELANGLQATVSASIGIALAPENGRDLDSLLQLADLAMYEAKLQGKNCFAFAKSDAYAGEAPLLANGTSGGGAVRSLPLRAAGRA